MKTRRATRPIVRTLVATMFAVIATSLVVPVLAPVPGPVAHAGGLECPTFANAVLVCDSTPATGALFFETFFTVAPVTTSVGDVFQVSAVSEYGNFAQPGDLTTITRSSSSAAVCSIVAGPGSATVTALAAGYCTLEARGVTYLIDGSQLVSTARWTITITKKSQTLTWVEAPDTLQVGRDAFLDVRATSGLQVTFTASGPCRIISVFYLRALDTPGQCVVTADQAGDGTWAPATSSQRTITIVDQAQSGQYLSWNLTRYAYWEGDTFTISATSQVDPNWSPSPVPIVYSVSGACTNVGPVVTTQGSGYCYISASQAGDGVYYRPATTIDQRITIDPAFAQSVVWWKRPATTATVGRSITFAAYTNVSQPVTARVDGPCTFTADPPTPPGQTPVAGGTVVGTGAGNCVITVSSPMKYSTGPTDGSIKAASDTRTVVFTAGVAPDAPTGVAARIVRPGTASVSFLAPASDGGTTITSYRAVCSPVGAGVARSTSGVGTTLEVSGLTPGATYQCRANATNAAGTGPASAPSASLVAVGAPGAPTAVTAERSGSGALSVAFTAPVTTSIVASNGGAPISSYKAVCSSSDGGVTRWATGSASPVVVGALTGGATYTCVAYAQNSAGSSAASTASPSVVARSVPAPPTGLTAVRTSSTRATLSFTPPASNGGSAITSYRVVCTSATGGPSSASGTGSPLVVVSLTPGADYTCRASATNAIGTSTASAPVAVTTPAV